MGTGGRDRYRPRRHFSPFARAPGRTPDGGDQTGLGRRRHKPGPGGVGPSPRHRHPSRRPYRGHRHSPSAGTGHTRTSGVGQSPPRPSGRRRRGGGGDGRRARGPPRADSTDLAPPHLAPPPGGVGAGAHPCGGLACTPGRTGGGARGRGEQLRFRWGQRPRDHHQRPRTRTTPSARPHAAPGDRDAFRPFSDRARPYGRALGRARPAGPVRGNGGRHRAGPRQPLPAPGRRGHRQPGRVGAGVAQHPRPHPQP